MTVCVTMFRHSGKFPARQRAGALKGMLPRSRTAPGHPKENRYDQIFASNPDADYAETVLPADDDMPALRAKLRVPDGIRSGLDAGHRSDKLPENMSEGMLMKRLLPVCGLLMACAPVGPPASDPDLPFVRPYRDQGDQCHLVGESSVTQEFLDDAADLVACPTDYEGLGVFEIETGAQQIAIYNSYTLFSVPVR